MPNSVPSVTPILSSDPATQECGAASMEVEQASDYNPKAEMGELTEQFWGLARGLDAISYQYKSRPLETHKDDIVEQYAKYIALDKRAAPYVPDTPSSSGRRLAEAGQLLISRQLAWLAIGAVSWKAGVLYLTGNLSSDIRNVIDVTLGPNRRLDVLDSSAIPAWASELSRGNTTEIPETLIRLLANQVINSADQVAKMRSVASQAVGKEHYPQSLELIGAMIERIAAAHAALELDRQMKRMETLFSDQCTLDSTEKQYHSSRKRAAEERLSFGS